MYCWMRFTMGLRWSKRCFLPGQGQRKQSKQVREHLLFAVVFAVGCNFLFFFVKFCGKIPYRKSGAGRESRPIGRNGDNRMKEKLYTIELNDGIKSGDECLFCWLERKLEQENLEFVLGSSYMEDDIRADTSRKGFCRRHTKMMYDYGNTLGNAWILKSRLEYMNQELKKQMAGYTPGKGAGFMDRFRKTGQTEAASAPQQWIRSEEEHCYVCGRMKTIYERMLDTFVYMLRNDPGFCELLTESKGFCIHHFADVLRVCEEKLKPQEKQVWIPRLGELMKRNLDRVQEDIDWLIEKYDYRNRDADWRQSQDAVQRTMQKLVGTYPADPVFKCRK